MGKKQSIEVPLHFGLIGKKLTHSFSKKFFQNKFERLALLEYTYTNVECEDELVLADFLLDAVFNLRGFNVTIPYKETIIPYLDSVQDEADKIQAVNTVLVKNGKLIGYNTDVYGFIESLKPLLKNYHKKALVLGTGGASKAIIYALGLLEIDYLLVSRKVQGEKIISYQDLSSDIIAAYTIIINTTPVGTSPDVSEYPEIPYQFLTKDHLVYDLVYNPEFTVFLEKSQENGASIQNGLLMLQLQAEKAWQIWNI